jgi:hypothetical protein
MKVIDLLNKIANGEELPPKIQFHNLIWVLKSDLDYCEDYYSKDLCNYLFYNKWALTNNLNDEVEILEEEKKIPDDLFCWFTMDYNDDLHEVIKKSNINFRNISEKLDELIDYLKSKGE